MLLSIHTGRARRRETSAFGKAIIIKCEQYQIV